MRLIRPTSAPHSTAVAVATTLAKQGTPLMLYPMSQDRFLVALTADHRAVKLADPLDPTPELQRLLGEAKGPAGGIGSTAFALSYGLGEQLRRTSDGISPNATLAEFSTIRSLLLVGREGHTAAGPDRQLLERMLLQQAQPLAQASSRHGAATYRIVDDGKGAYASVFGEVKRELHRGNTYQAVLSCEGTIRFTEDWTQHFAHALGANEQRLMPYLHTSPTTTFYGSSSVPHLRLEDRFVRTTVVAGTLPVDVGASASEHSNRHRAEHLMLVDLERNDLGSVAEPDGVAVYDLMREDLRGATKYLTTQVRAHVSPRFSNVDVLLANFPRSVVTGAPKTRTMQIIRRAENRSRGFYGGALGMAGESGREIDALTVLGCVLVDGPTGRVPTGGGVTLLSELQDELSEIDAKRRTLLS